MRIWAKYNDEKRCEIGQKRCEIGPKKGVRLGKNVRAKKGAKLGEKGADLETIYRVHKKVGLVNPTLLQ